MNKQEFINQYDYILIYNHYGDSWGLQYDEDLWVELKRHLE